MRICHYGANWSQVSCWTTSNIEHFAFDILLEEFINADLRAMENRYDRGHYEMELNLDELKMIIEYHYEKWDESVGAYIIVDSGIDYEIYFENEDEMREFIDLLSKLKRDLLHFCISLDELPTEKENTRAFGIYSLLDTFASAILARIYDFMQKNEANKENLGKLKEKINEEFGEYIEYHGIDRASSVCMSHGRKLICHTGNIIETKKGDRIYYGIREEIIKGQTTYIEWYLMCKE